MADWQRTLHIEEEWNEAKDDKIDIWTLAKTVADKLRKLAPFPGFDDINDERDSIADELEGFAEDPDGDKDDFDCIMTRLYDWADTPLDSNWNGKKVCWVKTF